VREPPRARQYWALNGRLGTGMFSDDTAADIREERRDAIIDGLGAEEAMAAANGALTRDARGAADLVRARAHLRPRRRCASAVWSSLSVWSQAKALS
jgi:hypothetical protein